MSMINHKNKTFSEDNEFSCYTFNQEQFNHFIQSAKSNQLENVKIQTFIIGMDIIK